MALHTYRWNHTLHIAPQSTDNTADFTTHLQISPYTYRWHHTHTDGATHLYIAPQSTDGTTHLDIAPQSVYRTTHLQMALKSTDDTTPTEGTTFTDDTIIYRGYYTPSEGTTHLQMAPHTYKWHH